jgi:hypothetical protein
VLCWSITDEYREAFMKYALSMAAAFVAASSSLASAAECSGPFRECAYAVNAVCSRDADGKQRMTYWDYPGKTMQFERCVGGIFEAAGQANPYKTGAAAARGRGAGLTVPYTELLYPRIPDR